MNYISSNIRFLRTLAGLSQGELAEKVGLNRGNITSYERNIAKPSIEFLPKLTDFFNVNLVDFIQKDLSKTMTRGEVERRYAKKDGKGETIISNNGSPTTSNAANLNQRNYKPSDPIAENKNDLGELPTRIENILTELNKINISYNQTNFYKDINRIAQSLEQIAGSLEQLSKVNSLLSQQLSKDTLKKDPTHY